MIGSFRPRLEVLPPAQRQLWPELQGVPRRFVLYGGTAIALRFGHRSSVDFDFFATEPFEVAQLLGEMPWLRAGQPLQSALNTYTTVLRRDEPVKLSFFGGLSLGRVGQPERTDDNVLSVASALDLAATKVAVIQQRAEKRDYLDVACLLRAGLRLSDMLGAARALYRDQFNPMISLKALCYFQDGDLPELPAEVKDFLAMQAGEVKGIPDLPRASDRVTA
jgi:hypothetical protein